MRKKKRKLVSKNKALTIRRLALLAGIFLLLVGAVVGAVMLLKPKAELGAMTLLPFTADDQWVFTGGGFYYITGSKLCYYDLGDPEKASEMQLASPDVSLVSSGSITAVYSGPSVQLVGASQPIDAGGQVLSVVCGARHVAVMRQDSGDDATVLVYDSTGTLVDTIGQSGSLLVDLGFGTVDGSDMLWTLALSTTGSAPVSTITTYTYGEGSSAAMSGVITLQSELVEDVYFSQSSIFVVTTSHLLKYDKAITAETYNLLTYGYRPVDFTAGSSRSLFLFTERSGSDSAAAPVQLISLGENDAGDMTSRTVALPDDVHSRFVIGGTRFMAISPRMVYTYNTRGERQSATELETPCDEAIKLSDTQILFRRGPEMRIMTLR